MPDLSDLAAVRLETDADGIALLTVNRPDKLNALNAQVIDELDRCIAHVRSTDAVRALILTGAGEKSFVAGAFAADFEAEGKGPFTYRAQGKKPITMQYWELPERLYDDPAELAPWARRAHDIAKTAKEKTAKEKTAKEKTAKEKTAKDKAAKDKATKDKAAKGRTADRKTAKPMARKPAR